MKWVFRVCQTWSSGAVWALSCLSAAGLSPRRIWIRNLGKQRAYRGRPDILRELPSREGQGTLGVWCATSMLKKRALQKSGRLDRTPRGRRLNRFICFWEGSWETLPWRDYKNHLSASEGGSYSLVYQWQLWSSVAVVLITHQQKYLWYKVLFCCSYPYTKTVGDI